MAQLAIKGHATRGKEVIELLEMFWGMNKHQITAIRKTYVYFIDEDGIIRLLNIQQILPEQFIVFTLEEFFEKYPYKAEDKVYVNSIDYQGMGIVNSMYWDSENNIIRYEVFSDKCNGYWKVEELQPYKEETMEEKLVCNEIMSLTIDTSKLEKRKIIFSVDAPNETELVLGNNFEIKVEDGKTYVVRKKPQYPRNYEECCHMLGVLMQNSLEYINKDCNKDYYYNDLKSTLNTFVSLKICRDAYWKIAGEQMGLDKPWEPEFRYEKKKYCIMTKDNKVISATVEETNRILVFPTEEMRDIFFDNFKELIEQCMELL